MKLKTDVQCPAYNDVAVCYSVMPEQLRWKIREQDNILLYKYWDLLSANSPNKNSLSLMRSNLIGHTIFLTSEKYRMTNQKPNTIFFTSEKIRIGFSRLSSSRLTVFPAFFPAFPDQSSFS